MNEQPDHIENPQMDKAQRVAYLIAAYIRGTITPLEHDELDNWVGESDENMQLFEELTDEKKIKSAIDWMEGVDSPRALNKIKEQLTFARYYTPRRIFQRPWQLAVAACLLLAVATAAFLLYKNNSEQKDPVIAAGPATLQDLQPGSVDKAMLTLADGSTIILDQAKDGTLATQDNSDIIKQNGQIIYNGGVAGSKDQPLLNTVTTPRGGSYPLTLSDGTKVWLNAASSIRFPAVFKGTERRVAITGEVYFEVAHLSPKGGSGKMPFIVEVKDRDMAIEVLGTHFNINAYSDEPVMKATLLEGSVKVLANKKAIFIKPGQQAQVDDAGIKTSTADTDAVMAWKNGMFRFRNTDLRSIMKQVSRWYDVDIEFETSANPAYNSILSRAIPASRLFEVLEENGGVHFKIEGKKVRVLP